MKHAILLFFVLLLSGLGTYIIVMDIHVAGQLHFVSASVGAGMLVTAVSLAVPLRIKDAVTVLSPLLPYIRGK